MVVDPRRYYADPLVCREISEFLSGRWAGVEGFGGKWVRWEGGRPLVIGSPAKVYEVVNKYVLLSPRAFYGSIEVFHRLSSRGDVEEGYESNVLYVTPFVDVDIVDENSFDKAWPYVLDALEVMYEYLCGEHGVCESIYVLWSGNGAHLRIHERAFKEVYELEHPLKTAYAVIEYLLRMTREKLLGIVRKSNGLIKIENLIAPKRVFTAPLSLHRRVDRVAITFKPEKISEFKPEWTNPVKPVHDPRAWREYREGEADDYAREALKKLGLLVERTVIGEVEKKTRLAEKPEEKIEKREVVEPGRFPVMALLQAVRYYLLTGDLEKAKSWGLNRAIFYAWAKYYGPGKQSMLKTRVRKYSVKPVEVGPDEVKWEEVGGEKALVSKRGWYVIGGIEQLPEDFDRYVARKFEEAGIDFREAWEKALEYVKKFPRGVLANPQEFYKIVYEPVRDRFVEKVLSRKTRTSGVDITKWLKSGKKEDKQ